MDPLSKLHILCSECEDSVAEFRCVECEQESQNSTSERGYFLCRSCSNRLHSLKKRQTHSIRNLTDKKVSPIVSSSSYPNSALKFDQKAHDSALELSEDLQTVTCIRTLADGRYACGVAGSGFRNGRYAWKFRINGADSTTCSIAIGVVTSTFRSGVGIGQLDDGWGYYSSGEFWHFGEQAQTSVSFYAGDIVSMQIDMDAIGPNGFGVLSFIRSRMGKGISIIAFSGLAKRLRDDDDAFYPAVHLKYINESVSILPCVKIDYNWLDISELHAIQEPTILLPDFNIVHSQVQSLLTKSSNRSELISLVNEEKYFLESLNRIWNASRSSSYQAIRTLEQLVAELFELLERYIMKTGDVKHHIVIVNIVTRIICIALNICHGSGPEFTFNSSYIIILLQLILEMRKWKRTENTDFHPSIELQRSLAWLLLSICRHRIKYLTDIQSYFPAGLGMPWDIFLDCLIESNDLLEIQAYSSMLWLIVENSEDAKLELLRDFRVNQIILKLSSIPIKFELNENQWSKIEVVIPLILILHSLKGAMIKCNGLQCADFDVEWPEQLDVINQSNFSTILHAAKWALLQSQRYDTGFKCVLSNQVLSDISISSLPVLHNEKANTPRSCVQDGVISPREIKVNLHNRMHQLWKKVRSISVKNDCLSKLDVSFQNELYKVKTLLHENMLLNQELVNQHQHSLLKQSVDKINFLERKLLINLLGILCQNLNCLRFVLKYSGLLTLEEDLSKSTNRHHMTGIQFRAIGHVIVTSLFQPIFFSSGERARVISFLISQEFNSTSSKVEFCKRLVDFGRKCNSKIYTSNLFENQQSHFHSKIVLSVHLLNSFYHTCNDQYSFLSRVFNGMWENIMEATCYVDLDNYSCCTDSYELNSIECIGEEIVLRVKENVDEFPPDIRNLFTCLYNEVDENSNSPVLVSCFKLWLLLAFANPERFLTEFGYEHLKGAAQYKRLKKILRVSVEQMDRIILDSNLLNTIIQPDLSSLQKKCQSHFLKPRPCIHVFFGSDIIQILYIVAKAVEEYEKSVAKTSSMLKTSTMMLEREIVSMLKSHLYSYFADEVNITYRDDNICSIEELVLENPTIVVDIESNWLLHDEMLSSEDVDAQELLNKTCSMFLDLLSKTCTFSDRFSPESFEYNGDEEDHTCSSSMLSEMLEMDYENSCSFGDESLSQVLSLLDAFGSLDLEGLPESAVLDFMEKDLASKEAQMDCMNEFLKVSSCKYLPYLQKKNNHIQNLVEISQIFEFAQTENARILVNEGRGRFQKYQLDTCTCSLSASDLKECQVCIEKRNLFEEIIYDNWMVIHCQQSQLLNMSIRELVTHRKDHAAYFLPVSARDLSVNFSNNQRKQYIDANSIKTINNNETRKNSTSKLDNSIILENVQSYEWPKWRKWMKILLFFQVKNIFCSPLEQDLKLTKHLHLLRHVLPSDSLCFNIKPIDIKCSVYANAIQMLRYINNSCSYLRGGENNNNSSINCSSSNNSITHHMYAVSNSKHKLKRFLRHCTTLHRTNFFEIPSECLKQLLQFLRVSRTNVETQYDVLFFNLTKARPRNFCGIIKHAYIWGLLCEEEVQVTASCKSDSNGLGTKRFDEKKKEFSFATFLERHNLELMVVIASYFVNKNMPKWSIYLYDCLQANSGQRHIMDKALRNVPSNRIQAFMKCYSVFQRQRPTLSLTPQLYIVGKGRYGLNEVVETIYGIGYISEVNHSSAMHCVVFDWGGKLYIPCQRSNDENIHRVLFKIRFMELVQQCNYNIDAIQKMMEYNLETLPLTIVLNFVKIESVELLYLSILGLLELRRRFSQQKNHIMMQNFVAIGGKLYLNRLLRLCSAANVVKTLSNDVCFTSRYQCNRTISTIASQFIRSYSVEILQCIEKSIH